MPTLYVENVPKELYEALRKRARNQRRSIAAEMALAGAIFLATAALTTLSGPPAAGEG